MSEDLGKAVLVLQVESTKFRQDMRASRGDSDEMKGSLDALAAVAKIAEDALKQVTMTRTQAAESAGSAEAIVSGVRGVSEEARTAARELGNVKVTARQGEETRLATDIQKEGIRGVGREADETTIKLEIMAKAARGSGGGGGKSIGGTSVGLLGAGIGAGILTLPAAGPAVVGLLGAIPVLAAGAAGALGVLALAFHGVGSAIGGNAKAYADLLPAQKSFVDEIRSMKGWVDQLQQTAAQALFPGLTAALHDALSPGTLNAVTQAIKEFGSAIGSAAQQWGKYIGSAQFQQIFGPIMAAAAQNLKTMSSAALSLFDAFGVLGRAAAPLTEWMTTEMAVGAKWVDNWLKAKDATGQLTGAMNNAKTSLTLVAGLIEALFKDVIALGTALYPVSQVAVKDLTDGLDALAKIIGNNKDAIRKVVSTALDGFVTIVKLSAKAIEGLRDGLGDIVGKKDATIATIAAIGIAITLALGPEAAGIAAALLAAGLIQQHWTAIKDWMVKWGPIIMAPMTFGISVAVAEIIKHWDTVKSWFETFAHGLADLFTHPIATLTTMFKDLGSAIYDGLKAGVSDFVDLIKSINIHISTWHDLPTGISIKWSGGSSSSTGTVTETAPAGGTGATAPTSPPRTASPGQLPATQAGLQGDALKAYITQAAIKLGLDPNAVLADAYAEGGLGGAIGDGGHAYGPFQMNNAGGVLTGKFAGANNAAAQAYATSPAGINDALSAMAKYATGLTGEAALAAIVTNYERPKDGGAGDIARGNQYLNGVGVPTSEAGIQNGAGAGTDPFGTPQAPPQTAAQKAAAKAAAALKASVETIRDHVKTVLGSINTDFTDGALSKPVENELLKRAKAINASLNGAGKDALPGIRTNLTTLKGSLQDGLAQATDDKKLKATVASIHDDLKNHLLSPDIADHLLLEAKKYNAQLKDGLLDDATRKAVEGNIAKLKETLKLDLTLAEDKKSLKADLNDLNSAVASGLFPAPVAAQAKGQIANIKKLIAEGTQASADAAKAGLKKLAATIKEGIADATAINSYKTALGTFATNLQETMNQTLGRPDVYSTPEALAAAEQGAQRVMAAMAKGLTGAPLTQAKAQLAAFQKTIENAMSGMEATITNSKSSFENAWTRLTAAGDSAFQKGTSATLAQMQAAFQTTLAQMKVMVTGSGFSDFLFGGTDQTPTEILLAQMQADHQTQADADAITAAQAQLATDQADPTTDPAAILSDQKAISDALYQQQLDQLQKQADLERTAANQQLQDAQTAAQTKETTAEQAYQDQQDQLQQALDDQVAAIELAFEDGNITASTAFDELTGLYTQNGIDITTLSTVIAGNIYDGVSSWTAPLMDLMADLQSQIQALNDATNGAINAATGVLAGGGGTVTSGGGSSTFQSGIGTYGYKPIPMANGAIVMPRYGGTIARLAEAGQAEAVLPVDNLMQMIADSSGNPDGDGGGQPVVLTLDGVELGRTTIPYIRAELYRHQGRNGTLNFK